MLVVRSGELGYSRGVHRVIVIQVRHQTFRSVMCKEDYCIIAGDIAAEVNIRANWRWIARRKISHSAFAAAALVVWTATTPEHPC